MPATATNKSKRQQGQFAQRVKIRLVQEGLSVSDLAREFGLNRNTVSRAIHHDLGAPTRERIADRLGISL